MADPVWPAIVGAVAGLGGTIAGFIGTSVRMTWKAAEIKEKINEDLAELRVQFTAQDDAIMNQFGNSLAAIREKVVQTELWNRDNFIRRADFATVIENINKSIDALSIRMDVGLAKIEAKIDKLQSRT